MAQLGVSYFGNRFLSHARRDLENIASCCNYVVHTVNEADLTYHKSVMANLFSDTRKAGLEVWADPWGLGGVFGGESFSKFLLDHRDSWQIMSDGKVVPAACMNRPEWKSYVMEWILSVRDMGAQVIFWDEPHIAFDIASEFSGIYSCVCRVCQDLFKKTYGGAQPAKINDSARQFRRDTMRNFLKEILIYAKGKGLKNALCLYAYKGNEEYDRLWNEAASLKELDIFGCDPYWRWHGRNPVDTYVSAFSKYVVETAQRYGKDSQVWIQAMRLPAGSENEISVAVDAAVKAGITHVAAWSYDGGELLDPVLSERPEQVWSVLKNSYQAHFLAK